MIRFGLIGKSLEHSFSKNYFQKKFKTLNQEGFQYQNFPLEQVDEVIPLIQNTPDLYGFNVTIPYKEAVLPLLDHIDDEAANAGAVNTVTIDHNADRPVLNGFNTDIYGFRKSIEPLLGQEHKKALILGTGGASKAVAYVLNSMNIDVQFVSRTPDGDRLLYKDLTSELMTQHKLIINCTPLGMTGLESESPPIPYHTLTPFHLLYDLVYNPAETLFLKEGKKRGTRTKNGLEMLELQAEKSWELWQQVIPFRHSQ